MIQVTVFNAHRRCRIRKNPIVLSVRRVLTMEHRLNRIYLGHDRSTDVLSFPMKTAGLLDGEVYVNLDRARLQAREHAVSLMHEVTRLVVHGVLHLAGYDDRGGAEKKRMRVREDSIVRILAGTSYGTGRR